MLLYSGGFIQFFPLLEKVFKHGRLWKVMERKDTTIGLSQSTKDKLNNWRSPGQSYDGAIQELLQKQTPEVEA